ncbi:Hypp667 [Branchiostoma lanceolatum]|uniref:Hypp667 protein n=1 Tax=Branchiostoma lanceolatum TaxID=7740 RepID=A0A8J9YK39_BRALA|nr:Hypp667 [Branchiostoma lanceolatum]
MPPPRKLASYVSDPHDFCRLCHSNQKINGTLQNIRHIFNAKIQKPRKKPPRGQQPPPEESLPPPVPIADVLRSFGLNISEQDFSKSHRICEKCCRTVIRIWVDMESLEKWRLGRERERLGSYNRFGFQAIYGKEGQVR